jgi:hypothetical protein
VTGSAGEVSNRRPPLRRYHYAFALKRVKGGYGVGLGLLTEHGDARLITLERELVNGEVLDAAALKR